MLNRLLIVLLLSALPCQAAVTLHATNSGPSQNGGAFTQTLPTVSNNDIVLVEAVATTCATANTAPYQTPSGWTQLANLACYALFYKIWHTGDSTSVTLTPQNGTGSWETSVSLSYSGEDTTTPIDANVNYCLSLNTAQAGTPTPTIIAPQVYPQWNNDMLVVFYADSRSFGDTITLPAGLTSEINNNPGPTARVGDLSLSSGAATGDYVATHNDTNHNIARLGIQVLVKAASGGSSVTQAAAQPTLACVNFTNTDRTDFGACYPQSGDLVILGCTKTSTSGSSAPSFSGFTQILDVRTSPGSGIAEFSQAYTGGSTSFTTTNCGADGLSQVSQYIVRNVRDSTAPFVDTYGTQETASGTTVATPSLTLVGTNDLLVNYYTSNDTSATFTTPTGMSHASDYSDASNNGFISYLLAPANPTGTKTGTFSTGSDLWGAAVAFKIGGGTVRHRASVY